MMEIYIPLKLAKSTTFEGRKVVEENFSEPGMTLLTYLRRRLGLCGTKLGCGEGGCGACTVMVSDIQVGMLLIRLFT